MLRLLSVLCFFVSTSAFGFRARDCAQNVWLKKGMLRTYDVKHTSIEFISFKTSSEEGSTKASVPSTTQESTMSVDPGITTGQSESTTQFSSTYGECSVWANNDRWMKREYYVAENIEKLRKDIAKGDGEYIDSLAHLSGCSASVKTSFAKILHDNYAELFRTKQYWNFASDVDQLMHANKVLASSCRLFPTGA